MSKVVNFWPHTPKFFDFFLGTTKFFLPINIFPAIYPIKLLLPVIFYPFSPKKLFFRLYRLKICFLALKNLLF